MNNILEKEYNRFKNSKIEIVVDTNEVLVVDLIPQEQLFGRCRFYFDKYGVSCKGDIEGFSLHLYNGLVVKSGNFNWKSTSYMEEKLEHSEELKDFDEDLMWKVINSEIKEQYFEDFDDLSKEEQKKLQEKWDDAIDMLGCHSLDKHRIEGIDEFFDNIEWDDGWEWYGSFFTLPYHFYIMLAMIGVINDYFKEKNNE